MIKYIYQNKSKGINMEDELIFSKKWFTLDKYYFKILTIITELADKALLKAHCLTFAKIFLYKIHPATRIK